MRTSTQTPAIVNEYERALARARKAGLRIVGQGRIKSDGTPIVCVSSSREPNRYYVVAICRARLVCECAAGLRGKLCSHRALVHARLLQRWREERDRVERQVEADLRESLLELHECHKILDAALRQPALRMAAHGDAPVVTQAEAGRLLQRGFSARRPVVADVRYPAGMPASDVVRGVYDVKPITIWK